MQEVEILQEDMQLKDILNCNAYIAYFDQLCSTIPRRCSTNPQ